MTARQAVILATHTRSGNQCEARSMFDLTCNGPLDCHELVPRGRWAAGYLDVTNTMSICRRHHDWITQMREGTTESRLIQSFHDRPGRDVLPERPDHEPW